MKSDFTSAKDFLGKNVKVKMDRPIHSRHPKHGWEYELNYGFVPETKSPDGEELDTYVIGVDEPVDEFEGICVAIIHRTDDDDDKLIVVTPDQVDISDEDIRKRTHFQEQWFSSEIIRSIKPKSYVETMKLTEISDSYRETADSFLKSSILLSVLEKYGRIEFEGAYAGNVMLHGDIDIKVIRDTEYTQDEMFAILKDIHNFCGGNFRSLFIKADWDDPRLGQQFPNGRYIGLKTYVNDERWKFDIWFISGDENNRDRGKLDISKSDLSEEQRLKILEFKQYRKENGLKVSGQKIYEAVLEKDFTDPELFFKNI